jgi:AcrR family transcriptional regulator
MSDEKRQYRMKRRAEQEAQTRRRITESAVELHGSLGPARTSMKAVAEHAGVPRSTVYRHFADEEALFGACSAHWAAENPPPDINRWEKFNDPDERLEVALDELYAYYRRSGGMLDKCLRDEAAVPIVGRLMGAYRQFQVAVTDLLTQGRGPRGKAPAPRSVTRSPSAPGDS